MSIFIFSHKKRLLLKMPFVSRGSTTSMAKRAQIVGYSTIMRGHGKVTLAQIAAKTGVLLSTCSNIIREAKCQAAEPGGNPDLCASVNLAPKPNSQKGCNAALTAEQKRHLVEVALLDSEHCRMTFGQLALSGRKKTFIFYSS